MSPPLFEIRGLRIAVFDERRAVSSSLMGPVMDYGSTKDVLGPGWVEAVPDMNLVVEEGEVLALVGESGSGKTVSLLGALDLLRPGSRVTGGETLFLGRRIYPLPQIRRKLWWLRRRSKRKKDDDTEWRRTVGMQIGMLFQDAIGAWTPDRRIGSQTGEVLEEHTDLTEEEIRQRTLDALGDVNLPREPKFFSFSHELSRGEAQRAMLAAALIKAPKLLIADEPLSGLDAPVAGAVLGLIRDLQRKRGMGMVIITHDLATVASIADRVAVMYGGRLVEQGPTNEVFHSPKHPYTEGLLGSIPWQESGRLRPIMGDPPRITELPDGCAFHPRCPYAEPACERDVPSLEPIGFSHAACIRKTQVELRGVRG